MGELPAPEPAAARLQPVFLLGMMGAGKSSVGRALAEASGGVFVDLDRRVELMFASSVPQLFELGEGYFRACERAALKTLVEEPGFAASGAIVATGGGVVVDAANLHSMASVGTCVYLDVPVPALVERLSSPVQRAQRPLLGDQATLAQRLQDLLSAREAAYRGAGLTVSGEGPIDTVASEILRLSGRPRP